MPPADGPSSCPPFLLGTFDWRINGLHLETPAPFDLLVSAAAADSNPWVALAAALERAKTGDHEAIGRLGSLLPIGDRALELAVLTLIGAAGTDRHLRVLEQALEGNDPDTRLFAADAAALAGRLWLVPAMLAAWERADGIGPRETIGFAISDLLEPDGGPLEAEAAVFRGPPVASLSPQQRRYREQTAATKRPERFPALVREAVSRVEAAGDWSAVWEGEPFDVVALARRFLAAAPTITVGGCIRYRRKFETATGVDCTRFFHALRPRPLEIEAVLEEFLEADPSPRFSPGVRYFFGHRIPD
jgi:hypothetical protein